MYWIIISLLFVIIILSKISSIKRRIRWIKRLLILADKKQ